MKSNSTSLFIEINDLNYVFLAGYHDENQKFIIIEKKITKNEEMSESNFIDINRACEKIKDNVENIERKLDCIFKEATIILDNFDYTSINISGYKRLNESQILKENISFILNSLKLTIVESEKQKSILHIFNSRSILDGKTLENLPIGLFGDFYSHELTFFLINNTDFNNIDEIFKNVNLNIKKILLKDFIEGTSLIEKEREIETFFKIKILKNNCRLSFFDNSSFRFSEIFNFGSNIILKDIAKICSINEKIVENILKDKRIVHNLTTDDDTLEKKYFDNKEYKKIKIKLIREVAEARIEEIINIIFNKNINLKFFKKNNIKIYVTLDDINIIDNFKKDFEYHLLKNKNAKISIARDLNMDQLFINAANLAFYGWKKEAIPIIQTKNSLITRIFKYLFE